MGTSTHNRGQKGNTPLVPSWLDQIGTNESLSTDDIDNADIPQIGAPDRFTGPRGEFTRYINSSGRNTGMAKKSISNYVRYSMGGSANATRRLGAARNSSARLLNIVGAFTTGGAQAVEQYLSLENLAKKPASEAFIAIADFVCPDGGPQDEGIARSAYIAAIEESPEIATIPFEDLTSEQMLLIVEKSMANVVCGRLLNDIGNRIIMLPDDIDIANILVTQIKQFIQGAISDAISMLGVNVNNLSQNRSIEIVNQVYQTAYEIMAIEGENE